MGGWLVGEEDQKDRQRKQIHVVNVWPVVQEGTISHPLCRDVTPEEAHPSLPQHKATFQVLPKAKASSVPRHAKAEKASPTHALRDPETSTVLPPRTSLLELVSLYFQRLVLTARGYNGAFCTARNVALTGKLRYRQELW